MVLGGLGQKQCDKGRGKHREGGGRGDDDNDDSDDSNDSNNDNNGIFEDLFQPQTLAVSGMYDEVGGMDDKKSSTDDEKNSINEEEASSMDDEESSMDDKENMFIPASLVQDIPCDSNPTAPSQCSDCPKGSSATQSPPPSTAKGTNFTGYLELQELGQIVQSAIVNALQKISPNGMAKTVATDSGAIHNMFKKSIHKLGQAMLSLKSPKDMPQPVSQKEISA
ncbi:hypothetical protein V8B97DRAFT_1915785 [Scleroderma yunnanense]